MNRYWWKVLLMIIFIVEAALLPAGASATPVVPDPFYQIIFVQFGVRQDFAVPGTFMFGGASMTATGVPVPLVSGHTVGSDAGATEASGRLVYFYAVVGPEDDKIVPLFVKVTLHGSGGLVPGVSVAGADAFIGVGGLTSVAEAIHTFQIPACQVGLCEMNISDTLGFAQLANHVAQVE